MYWGNRATLICSPKTCTTEVAIVLAIQNSFRNSFLVVKSLCALQNDLPVRASAALTGNRQLCHHCNQLKYFNQSLISMVKRGVQLLNGPWICRELTVQCKMYNAIFLGTCVHGSFVTDLCTTVVFRFCCMRNDLNENEANTGYEVHF